MVIEQVHDVNKLSFVSEFKVLCCKQAVYSLLHLRVLLKNMVAF